MPLVRCIHGHARSPKCVRKRPKGVQRSERLRKYLNPRAKGGRFEPAQRGTRLTRANGWKLLWRKGFACSRARAAVSRNGPKKPPIAPSNPDRSGFRVPSAHRRSVLTRVLFAGARGTAAERSRPTGRVACANPSPESLIHHNPGAVPRRGSAPESSTQHASKVTDTVTVACCGAAGAGASAR
jgi:hypothetical protein